MWLARILALVAVLVAPVLASAQDTLISPADVYELAWADLQRVPPTLWHETVYLSVAHLPPKDRPNAVRVLSYHVNSLSRNPELTPPTAITLRPALAVAPLLTLTPVAATPFVLANTAIAKDCLLWDAVLLRINMRDYRDAKGRGFPKKVWESLRFFDPDYHILIKEEWSGGIWAEKDGGDGKFYKAGTYKRAFQAPWLNPRTAAALSSATRNEVPVLRGDFFYNQTAIQFGRAGHGYYDFLDVKDEKDFQALVGVNLKLIEEQYGEWGAVIKKSALVAVNNRHLRRQDAFGRRSYWYTLDFNSSTDKQNAVRILDGLKRDATEQVGSLPNRLPGFLLADAKGKLQDVAPNPAIAGNTRADAPFATSVHANLSCLTCHQGALIPFNDYTRKLQAAGNPLQSPDFETALKLRRLYATNLLAEFNRDVEDYNQAFYTISGYGQKVYAAKAGAFWNQYQEVEITVEVAAREFGVTPQRLLAVLNKEWLATKQQDPVLAAFTMVPPDTMRREHLNELVPTIHGYLKKYP